MQKLDIYKCNVCGNIISILHVGGGQLVCCNEPMQLITENTVEASKEKHIPVTEKVEGGILVKIGSQAHPMEEKHYIEWIEVIVDNKSYRKFLKPGDAPEAFFPIKNEAYKVRAYCNIHGLWKN
jgi:superoxide reductase